MRLRLRAAPGSGSGVIAVRGSGRAARSGSAGTPRAAPPPPRLLLPTRGRLSAPLRIQEVMPAPVWRYCGVRGERSRFPARSSPTHRPLRSAQPGAAAAAAIGLGSATRTGEAPGHFPAGGQLCSSSSPARNPASAGAATRVSPGIARLWLFRVSVSVLAVCAPAFPALQRSTSH